MNSEYWEIVWYGTGMSPQSTRYNDEATARKAWDRMKDDPYAGAHCLRRVEVVARRAWPTSGG